LKVIRDQISRAAFLDDDDIDVSIETPSFAKEMDGEERTGRPTADNSNAIVVLEAPGLRKCA
jgi:hypothetical protein